MRWMRLKAMLRSLHERLVFGRNTIMDDKVLGCGLWGRHNCEQYDTPCSWSWFALA